MSEHTVRISARRIRRVLLAACVGVSPSFAQETSRTSDRDSAVRAGGEITRATNARDEVSPAVKRHNRIAHLVARWDSLSSSAIASERRRFAAETRDTIEAGLFRIRTTASLHRRVVLAALDASAELQYSLDARSLAAIRDGDVTVVALLDDGSPWRRESLLASARRDNAYCCELRAVSWLLPDPLPQAMRDLAIGLVSQSFDGALREWLLQSSLPVLPRTAREEEDARVELGTSESEAARACLTGDDRACSVLLDLHGHPENPLVAWYSQGDYRALAARVRLAPTDPHDAPAQQRDCLAGATEVCETFLRSLAGSRIPSPTLQGPRLSLLRHALALGGPGALQRLRSTPGDIGARLAAASRLDESRLIQRWRATMTDGARASVRPTAPIAAASLCWMLVVTGLGLRRTKR